MNKNELIKFIPTEIPEDKKIDCTGMDEKSVKKIFYNLMREFAEITTDIPFAHIIKSDIDTVFKLEAKIRDSVAFVHDENYYLIIQNKMLLKEDKEKLVAKNKEIISPDNIITSWYGSTIHNSIIGRLQNVDNSISLDLRSKN